MQGCSSSKQEAGAAVFQEWNWAGLSCIFIYLCSAARGGEEQWSAGTEPCPCCSRSPTMGAAQPGTPTGALQTRSRGHQFIPWALKQLERHWSGPSCGSWWAEALISRGHQINTAAPARMGAGWPGCRQGYRQGCSQDAGRDAGRM